MPRQPLKVGDLVEVELFNQEPQLGILLCISEHNGMYRHHEWLWDVLIDGKVVREVHKLRIRRIKSNG